MISRRSAADRIWRDTPRASPCASDRHARVFARQPLRTELGSTLRDSILAATCDLNIALTLVAMRKQTVTRLTDIGTIETSAKPMSSGTHGRPEVVRKYSFSRSPPIRIACFSIASSRVPSRVALRIAPAPVGVVGEFVLTPRDKFGAGKVAVTVPRDRGRYAVFVLKEGGIITGDRPLVRPLPDLGTHTPQHAAAKQTDCVNLMWTLAIRDASALTEVKFFLRTRS